MAGDLGAVHRGHDGLARLHRAGGECGCRVGGELVGGREAGGNGEWVMHCIDCEFCLWREGRERERGGDDGGCLSIMDIEIIKKFVSDEII